MHVPTLTTLRHATESQQLFGLELTIERKIHIVDARLTADAWQSHASSESFSASAAALHSSGADAH
jgi:hypothetical protein